MQRNERAVPALSIRQATKADAPAFASLLAELGFPSQESEVRARLDRFLKRPDSRILVAEADGEVVGCLAAERVPYFPNGSTVCRVTALVVSASQRSRGIGARLLAAATEYARDHGCSGIELTSGMPRVDAHRFYEREGFARTSYRFFRPLR